MLACGLPTSSIRKKKKKKELFASNGLTLATYLGQPISIPIAIYDFISMQFYHDETDKVGTIT